MKETELINLRGKREKHFLQENGDIIAKIYNDDVNFFNNGIYEEIDNNLIKEDDYYYNKKNSYKVMFKENSNDIFMKYLFQNHYINFEIDNGNETTINISKNDNQFSQQIAYNNVFNNIDFVYDILPSNVKENIFINDSNSLNEKICFKITSDLDLSLNDDNSISVGNILNLEKPFIIDSEGKKCNYVLNNLIKEQEFFLLELKLDVEQILKENLKFPIVIDPTIINYGDNNSVYDTYIYPGDTNDVRYDKEYLKVGVDSNGKTNRTLIKFDLPTIGTGSQIIEAELDLRGYPDLTNSYASDIVTVHRITEPWTESGANWNNMNDKFDSRVEAAFESSRDYYYDGNTLILSLNGDDLTNLVKKWYSMYPNYGLMLKTADEVYHQSVIPMFFSKNNTMGGTNPKPLLIIRYRNQNGLEEYMDYKMVPFNNGNAYINSYNGNLTTKFGVGETINGKYPINLDLVYNTNDVILNNDLGYGKGYKLSLQQTIKSVVIDNRTYLEYTDEDGTLHYFVNDNGTYVDEDGLNLTITQSSNVYTLTDKNNNIKRFTISNNVGHLTEIENLDGNIVTVEYNNDFTISRITDANSNQINISYGTNIINIASPEDTIELNYTSNKLSSIVRQSGSTSFSYNNADLISSITDEDNLKVGFEYYDQDPHRIKKVCEYATDDTIGNYYNITYNYNSSTIKNNNNNVLTMTFNDNGSIESNSNLSSGEDIFNAYGRIEEYSEPVELDNDLSYLKYKNKLLCVDLPCRYVKNYITDSSFENNSTIFTASSGTTLSVVSEQSNTGQKSLKAINSSTNQTLTKSFNVSKGNHYTFSASIKNSSAVKISLSYTDSNNNLVEEFEKVDSSNIFERSDVSIFYPSNAVGNLVIKIYLVEPGITYIDDIQLEEGEIANPYNLLDNSDFSNGLTGWTLDAIDLNGNDVPTSSIFEVITLSTGKNALKVKMSPLYQSSFYKQFPICGKAGDTYKISFWYKNKGLKGNNGEFARTNNRVIINFNYTDTQYGHGVAPSKQFNPNENEWQFFSTSFTAEHDFNSMYVNFFQTFNANEFYITNLYVMKDYRTINYDYDENGNIISVSNLDNQETKFSYDENNELIKLLSPNGTNFKYEYNKYLPSKINTAFSVENILTKIKYDGNGNPITTKIIPSIERFDIIGGGMAKIRIKGTNKYIKLSKQDIVVTDRDCYHNYWYIDCSNGDYDKIFNPVVKNRFLAIDNNDHVSTNEANMLIYFNNDESVYIKKYGTNKCLKYDENLNELTVATLDENDDSFKFYLEITNREKFIENNATYSSDGRFVTSTSDAMVNVTSYQYDSNTGLLLSKTTPNGTMTEYTYNNKNQLSSIVEGNKEVEYTYNNNNLLSNITFDDKNYQFEYDEFLNINKVKLNSSTLIQNNFDNNNGNLTDSLYGNGNTISFEYDEMDRIKKIIKMDDQFNYKYGSSGEIAKVVSNSDIYKYKYDMSKKLVEYKFNDFKTKYEYDPDYKILKKTHKFNNIVHTIDNSYDDNQLFVMFVDDNNIIRYYYDSLNRLIETNINTYTYKNKGKRSSMLIENIQNIIGTHYYKYDKMNNITHIYLNGNLKHEYYYDDYNQLIREVNYDTNESIEYTYNGSGNITNKKIYDLTNNTLLDENVFEYSNVNWTDQLTSFDNLSITYDSIGNPLTIGNDSLQWTNGRQLKKYNNIEFKYNKDGLRIKKINGTDEIDYFLEGDRIILEKRNNDVIYYIYSELEDLIGFIYNNLVYYYVKNVQNDIIAIVDSNNSIITKYTYDTWGNIISIVDATDNPITNPSNVGLINPFRYRSYYYDSELELYYLNNRYYNPKIGRFINIDGFINSNKDMLSHNLYLYTSNNYCNYYDRSGNANFKIVNTNKFMNQVFDNVTKQLNKLTQKTIIRAGSKIASFFGLKSSAELLYNSTKGKPRDIYYGRNSSVSKKIKNTAQFQNLVHDLQECYPNQKFNNEKFTITFPYNGNKDLFFGIHNADVYVSGELNNKSGKLSFIVLDKYDFTSSKKGGFTGGAGIINNIGYIYQRLDIINNFYVMAQFDYCVNCCDE